MKKAHLDELCGVFTKIRTRKEALALLKDILTLRELASIAERWQIVKMLVKGMPQRNISSSLGVSITKVTRGSRVLRRSRGGFTRFLKHP